MSTDTILRSFRTRSLRISEMAPAIRDIYWSTVFRELERRASSGDYKDVTVSNLGFFQENTCDSPSSAAKGVDEARNLWDHKYGTAFKNMHWHFYTLRDFVRFGVGLLTAHPDAWCSIHMDETDRVQTDGRFASHESCDDTPEGFRGCDICCLEAAMTDRSGEVELVEEGEREVAPGVTIALESLVYDGVRLEAATRWQVDESQNLFVAQRMCGQLGRIFQGSVDWTRYMDCDE